MISKILLTTKEYIIMDKDFTILICDDSLLARRNLKVLLESLNFNNIIEVADGQSAIDTYKAEIPDITFLDIVMPVKDGITAVKEIREIDPNAFIVMVSSVGTQAHLKEAIKAGAMDFINKPATVEQLKKVITMASKKN